MNRYLSPAAWAIPIVLFAFLASMHAFSSIQKALFLAARAESTVWQFGSLGAFLGLAAVFIVANRHRLQFDGRLLVPLSLAAYGVVTSFGSILPLKSALYALAYAAFCIAAVALWQAPDSVRRTSYKLGAAAILVACGYLFATLPLTARSVGGVPPNQLSHAASVVVTLAIMSGSRLRYGLLALGAVLLAHTNSRAAMASTLIFLAVLAAFYPHRFRLWMAAASVAVAALFGLVVLSFPGLGISQGFADFLALNDVSRGLNSGLTGRTTYWAQTAQIIGDRELFGLGFQTRGTTNIALSAFNSVHSAALNAYLDLGLLGLTLLIGLLGWSTWVWTRRAFAGSFEARAVLAWQISMVPTFAIEPTYLSLYQPALLVTWFFVVGAAAPHVADQLAARPFRPRKTDAPAIVPA